MAGASALAASAQPSAAISLPKKVRVAIIGLDGHVGEITGPLDQLPDVEIVAISDPDATARTKTAKHPRVAAARQYGDYRDLLNREQLDVAAICNNNGERAQAILDCARKGLHVIAEKPFALNRKDLAAVRKAAEDRKISLGTLLPLRFDPPYLALKQLVEQGTVGEVAQIDAQKSYQAGERAAWYLKRASYGGSIAWIGIHMIDLMRWISGREFVETAGFQGHIGFPNLGEMENVTASIFRLDNGGTATLRMDYLRPEGAGSHGDDRIRLAGTKGVIEYMEATGVTVLESGKKPRKLGSLPPKQWVFVDFLQSTYNGTKPMLPISDIWRVNEATLAAQEAADKKAFTKILHL